MSQAPPTRSMADVAAYEERMPGQDASERAMAVVHVERGRSVEPQLRYGVQDRAGARNAVSGPVGGEVRTRISWESPFTTALWRFAPFLESEGHDASDFRSHR